MPFPAAPTFPYALLRFRKNGSGAPDPHWDLLTAVGDGVSATVTTRLTNVAVPVDDGTANYRLELVYKPGEYVTALIDGIVGATVTGASLPNPTYALAAGNEFIAGVGSYVVAGAVGDRAQSSWHSIMLEHYRA